MKKLILVSLIATALTACSSTPKQATPEEIAATKEKAAKAADMHVWTSKCKGVFASENLTILYRKAEQAQDLNFRYNVYPLLSRADTEELYNESQRAALKKNMEKTDEQHLIECKRTF